MVPREGETRALRKGEHITIRARTTATTRDSAEAYSHQRTRAEGARTTLQPGPTHSQHRARHGPAALSLLGLESEMPAILRSAHPLAYCLISSTAGDCSCGA